jgi:hypothetical protein
METDQVLETVDDLFADEEVMTVPSAADRYRYKKRGGSSDTKTTSDEFT